MVTVVVFHDFFEVMVFTPTQGSPFCPCAPSRQGLPSFPWGHCIPCSPLGQIGQRSP